jgi:hypothetical protein
VAHNEAGVVNAIYKAIKAKYPDVWWFKVVGSPYQMAGVPDVLCCINGMLIGLEAKFQRPGESADHARARATPQQRVEILKINRAGGIAAVVLSVDEALDLISRGMVKREREMMKVKRKYAVEHIAEDAVAVGDFADHRSRTLDPRRVAKVDHATGAVWFKLLTDEPSGPFRLEDYTYTREVVTA